MRKAMAAVIIAFSGFSIISTMTPAQANSLVTTSPISGSTLGTAPSAVSITAQVALIDSGNSITVTATDGTRVDDGVLTIDGVNAIIGLKTLTLSGVYTVTYSLLADNDVPLAGTFTFNFTAPTVISSPSPRTSSPSNPTSATTNSSATSIFVIVLLFLAFLVLVGLSLYARKIFKKK